MLFEFEGYILVWSIVGHQSMNIDVLQVESLTSARKSALSGSEPSDAIRVVNALLTQIDQIKK